MAVESDYDPGHIKDVGSELWRSLLRALGEKVTKNNLHGVLKQTAQRQKDTNASSTLRHHVKINCTKFIWNSLLNIAFTQKLFRLFLHKS